MCVSWIAIAGKNLTLRSLRRIQSWLRYEAASIEIAVSSPRVMKMRWVLRYKESGKPKARLVIIGYHDPRVGSEDRTEAPVASRRGRSLFFITTAHKRFSIETEDVKNAFLQGTFDDVPPGELAVEPVPVLRKALKCETTKLLCSRKRAAD